MNVRVGLSFFLAFLFALPALAAPTKLAQQGRVLDGTGAPLSGTHAMVFSLYEGATDGPALWTEERSVGFEAGYYSITLGEQVALDDLLFTAESVWLEVSINGEALTPRQEVVSVPYALRATAAEHVEGGLVDAEEISVDGTVVIDASGSWVGPTPAVGWGDLSDVPADIADGDQDTDTLAGLACTEAQIPKWDAASSLWVCGEDIDTDTLDPNTDTLLGLPCADGYIAKVDGVSGLWDCAIDADSFADLAGVCVPGDIPVLDSVSGAWICGTDTDTVTSTLPWSAVVGIPADLADGDQDTITTSLAWSAITGVPADLADGDQDTQITSVPWNMLTGVPADLADGDQDTNTDVLAALPCTDGQIASYHGATSSWLCINAAVLFDADEDGVLAWDDCDDSDPTTVNDMDCDGVLTAADCDDTDPSSMIVAEDGDCDGTITSADCDDTDSSSTIVAEDGDCDGTITSADCDDTDSSSTVIADDTDCDGVLTAADCDDTDASSTVVADDTDCDGSPNAADCDDADPAIFPGAVEVECDSIDNNCSGSDSCQFTFASSQTIDGTIVTCSSTAQTAAYTQCNDLQTASGLYFPNGITCGPSWSTTNSSYSDTAGFCASLTGSTQFEAYYACGSSITRATWANNVWGTTSDNGYTQHVRCYH